MRNQVVGLALVVHRLPFSCRVVEHYGATVLSCVQFSVYVGGIFVGLSQERQSDKTQDEQMPEVQYWEEGGETVDAVKLG